MVGGISQVFRGPIGDHFHESFMVVEFGLKPLLLLQETFLASGVIGNVRCFHLLALGFGSLLLPLKLMNVDVVSLFQEFDQPTGFSFCWSRLWLGCGVRFAGITCLVSRKVSVITVVIFLVPSLVRM